MTAYTAGCGETIQLPADRKKNSRRGFSAAAVTADLCLDAVETADPLFFRHERQQPDKACSQDRLADSALEQGRSTSSTARQDAAFAVDQGSECFEVFVVDIHRPEYTAAAERAAHFFLLQTSPAFAKFFQVST